MNAVSDSSTFPSDVTVGVVSHDSAASVVATLRGVVAAGCPPDRIVLVDSASTDGTVAVARSAAPGLTTVELPDNRGPNPARNACLRTARTRFVLLLDADVIVPSAGTVPLLRAALSSDPEAAAAVPLVVFAETPDVIQYAGTYFHYVGEAVNRWQGRTLVERGSEMAELGCASGNCLLLRREVALDLGGFDEAMFMGKEDSDLPHRLRLAGWRIWEVPDAVVRHTGGERDRWLVPYQIRNRWYFILKNYSGRTLLLLAPVLAVHEVLQATYLIAAGEGRAYLAALRSFRSLLPSLRSARAEVRRHRSVADREILRSDPFVVRADMLRGGIAGRLRAAYDGLLRIYWRAIGGAG